MLGKEIAAGIHLDEAAPVREEIRYGNAQTTVQTKAQTRAQVESGYINQKELRVIGMSRSGNHAVINWILRQTQGRACFLNCVEGKTNPFTSARPLADGLPYQTNGPELKWEFECAGHFSPKDLLIYSYEDTFLGYVCHPRFEQHHDRWVGPSRQRFDILILRDPFNLFASRRRAGLSEISAGVAIRIWKQHAREFVGQRRYLTQPRVLVNYNRWATERGYRQQLAARLGLRFTDAGVHRVDRTGGGSSFDGLAYDGRAGEMRVLERWRAYRDDPTYWRLFDPEVIELSRQIFGPLGEIDYFLASAPGRLARGRQLTSRDLAQSWLGTKAI